MGAFRISLARFAYDWVGGNISGLAQLADTLYGYAAPITDVTSALDSQVHQVVGATWKGTAATGFSASWRRDSATARAVGLLSDQIAGIVGQLAVKVSQTEAALEQAADQARAHGVPIGADGVPPQACYASTGAAASTAQQWLSAYQNYYTACMHAADNARQSAAAALAATAKQVTKSGKSIVSAGNGVTAADLLGDLLASPSAKARDSRADLAEIDEELAKLNEKIGDAGSVRPYLKDLDETLDKLDDADADLDAAKESENVLTKLADVRMGDVVQQTMKALQGGGAHVKTGDGGVPDVPADGDGEALSSLAKLAKGLDDIPFIDWAAAGAGTALSTYSDVTGGHESVGVALPEEGVSNFGGMAVAAEIGGPEGMVAGILLPDAIHNNITAPLADIHQHGVVEGLLMGPGDADIETMGDAASLVAGGLDRQWTEATTITDAGRRLWDDL